MGIERRDEGAHRAKDSIRDRQTKQQTGSKGDKQ